MLQLLTTIGQHHFRYLHDEVRTSVLSYFRKYFRAFIFKKFHDFLIIKLIIYMFASVTSPLKTSNRRQVVNELPWYFKTIDVEYVFVGATTKIPCLRLIVFSPKPHRDSRHYQTDLI